MNKHLSIALGWYKNMNYHQGDLSRGASSTIPCPETPSWQNERHSQQSHKPERFFSRYLTITTNPNGGGLADKCLQVFFEGEDDSKV